MEKMFGDRLMKMKDENKFAPKKRISLSAVERFYHYIIVFVFLLFAYYVWPFLAPKSFAFFSDWLRWLFLPGFYSKVILQILVEGIRDNPVSLVIEILVIAVCVWKLVFRAGIVALFRIRCLVMIVASAAWTWFLYYSFIGVQHTKIWEYYVAWYDRSWLIARAFLYPIGEKRILLIIPVIASYVVFYLVVKLTCWMNIPGVALSEKELDSLGLLEVISRASRGRWLFYASPRIYVNSSISRNAFCAGRDICIARDVLTSGDILERQGTLAHELGHYYHHDITVNFICKACLEAFFLPFSLIGIVLYIVSAIVVWIPFIGSMLGSVSILSRIVLSMASRVLSIVDLVFYFVDGRRAELGADRFAVDIGYGYGLYLFLKRFGTRRGSIRELFDVHPSEKTRCRCIKSRIVYNWGENYFSRLEDAYGTF